MDFHELVKKRQSVRSYSVKPIERSAIDTCLEASRLAPSACNSQPWSFIVVDEEPLRTEFAKAVFGGIYKMNSFAEKAPAFILVIKEASSYIARLGGYFKGLQYSLIDIGIACEHLVLQAQDLGIGTCWLGWFNEKAVKRVLNIQRSKSVDIIISMGYPADDQMRDKKRRTIDEIRRYNR